MLISIETHITYDFPDPLSGSAHENAGCQPCVLINNDGITLPGNEIFKTLLLQQFTINFLIAKSEIIKSLLSSEKIRINTQSAQSLCWSLEYFMSVELLSEHF